MHRLQCPKADFSQIPTPHHPESNIAKDVITDLPESKGFTIIIIVEIVNYHGPQFTSKVWSNYMEKLGDLGQPHLWIAPTSKQTSREGKSRGGIIPQNILP